MRRVTATTAALTALLLAGASASQTPQPAPVSQLLAGVDVPYAQFQLENGLTVLVHEDRTRFVWVVVGDASVVRPRLEGLGLPVETAVP